MFLCDSEFEVVEEKSRRLSQILLFVDMGRLKREKRIHKSHCSGFYQ